VKTLLSHFDFTPKTVFVLFSAILTYWVFSGKLTKEGMDVYLGLAGALLVCLKPSRKESGTQVDSPSV